MDFLGFIDGRGIVLSVPLYFWIGSGAQATCYSVNPEAHPL
jgi:hypothetical protein